MPAIDAGLVFLPRFTTLVGETEFTTAPLDVSGQAGTQFQVWRGALRTSGGTPVFTLFIEESLDAETWALGPSTPQGFVIAENAVQFFAYSFRLRWFRLRIVVSGTNPMVSCWAEGILRAGDGGMWGMPAFNSLSAAGAVGDGSSGGAGGASGRPAVDPWALYSWNQQFKRQVLEDDAHYFKRISNLPQPPWVPHSGIPVTPPQLQFNKGP